MAFNITSKDVPNGPTHQDSAQLRRLLQIVISLSGERRVEHLYEQIIEAAQELTHADGATLYIVDKIADQATLRFRIVRNTSLGFAMGGASGHPITLTPIELYLPDGTANHHNVCAWTYHQKKPINILDVYDVDEFDFSGTRAFDKTTGYRSASMLTIPLVNHADEVIGILQLLNAQDPETGAVIPFDAKVEPIAAAFAASAAITLDNQILIQGHRDLLDAFVKAIAKAIDAKSPHTSLHCQRVPHLTELLAQAACDATQGPLQDFALDDDGWYELRVAAWLHDCGKLSTPDYLLDKSTKLHLLIDGIDTVKARFAALVAQLELRAAQTADSATQANLQEQIRAHRDDCAFIERANKGGEYMSEQDQERIRTIAALRWTDIHGVSQPLLTPEETNMLCIARGTINAEERARINDHINVSIEILEALPFPRQLARVPEYAGGHHERVDGTGYPRGLRGDQMSWPARMMAIADVFEALTASERPYKAPMKLSQALGILKNMALNGHIDPDLYTLFIDHEIWRSYGQTHLLPQQLDVVDGSVFSLAAAGA